MGIVEKSYTDGIKIQITNKVIYLFLFLFFFERLIRLINNWLKYLLKKKKFVKVRLMLSQKRKKEK